MKKNRTIIIAEAGVNHNGDINLAKKLIGMAAEAGADFIKFQSFKTEKIVSPSAEKAAYQKKNLSDAEGGQYEMLRKLELDFEKHKILYDFSISNNIQFISTPFDLDSVDLLEKLGVSRFKISSGEITNMPLLKKIGNLKKPVFLSTGMAKLGEIETALDQLMRAGLPKKKITVLHCNTQYPTPVEDVNLRAMCSIASAFEVSVGYSDHTLGIEIPVAAVALGAEVIEKHFTLDRNLPGPDHRASLEPAELKQMIKAIRNVESAMGSPVKKPSPSEITNINVVRKSIHLAMDKRKGEKLAEEDLILLRPGDGVSPVFYDYFIGRKLKSDLPAGHKLDWIDLG